MAHSLGQDIYSMLSDVASVAQQGEGTHRASFNHCGFWEMQFLKCPLSVLADQLELQETDTWHFMLQTKYPPTLPPSPVP